MTKSERLPRTYASLRFMGDSLDPRRITKILKVQPTLAYRGGELYKRVGDRDVIGRTNLWLLSSRNQVNSTNLSDQLAYLLSIVHSSSIDHTGG